MRLNTRLAEDAAKREMSQLLVNERINARNLSEASVTSPARSPGPDAIRIQYELSDLVILINPERFVPVRIGQNDTQLTAVVGSWMSDGCPPFRSDCVRRLMRKSVMLPLLDRLSMFLGFGKDYTTPSLSSRIRSLGK